MASTLNGQRGTKGKVDYNDAKRPNLKLAAQRAGLKLQFGGDTCFFEPDVVKVISTRDRIASVWPIRQPNLIGFNIDNDL